MLKYLSSEYLLFCHKITEAFLIIMQYSENKGYAKKVFIKLKYRGEGIVLIDGTNLSDKKIIVNRFSIDIDKKQIKVFE